MACSATKRNAAVALCLLVLANVPAFAQHLGIYHWAGEVDSLRLAAEGLDRFSADTIRIFLGGKYDYEAAENTPNRFAGVPRPLTLARIARLPRYRALFDNVKIHTIWLTAYPVFDYGRGPEEIDLRRPRLPENEWRSETVQMEDLVDTLYRYYGTQDRVVLISNNETDEKLREIAAAGGDPENEVRALERMRRGVDNARLRYPKAKLKVLFGVEVKLWKGKLPAGSNALDSVLPKLHYDFVSFSSWEVATHPEQLNEALDDIARRTRVQLTPLGRALFGEHHVLVGEFGFAREWQLPPAPIFQAVFDALRSGRTPYAVYWQLYDNARGDVRQFGLLDHNHQLTVGGKALQELAGPLSKLPKRAPNAR
jgi:hypothetical protein